MAGITGTLVAMDVTAWLVVVSLGVLVTVILSLRPWAQKRRERDLAVYADAVLREDRQEREVEDKARLVAWAKAHREAWNPHTVFERAIVDVATASVSKLGVHLSLRVISAAPEPHTITITKGLVYVSAPPGEEPELGALAPEELSFNGRDPARFSTAHTFALGDAASILARSSHIKVTVVYSLSVGIPGENKHQGQECQASRWVEVRR